MAASSVGHDRIEPPVPRHHFREQSVHVRRTRDVRPESLKAEQFGPIAATASSSCAWRRPVMTTLAPCSTNSRAIAKPMPELPPVTTATLPSIPGT